MVDTATLNALNEALRDIPLTQAMGLRAVRADGCVAITAPLAPNANHKGTAFGGSLHAAAVLAGWGWLWARLRRDGVDAQVVIMESRAGYLAPASAEFTAVCEGAPEEELRRFLALLGRRGKARLTLECRVECAGLPVMRFSGDYVAVAAKAQGR